MIAIVDRIQMDFVVVEVNGVFEELPLSLFPYGLEEGDILKYDDGKWSILEDESEARREKMEDLLHGLFERDIDE